jgi:membrane protein
VSSLPERRREAGARLTELWRWFEGTLAGATVRRFVDMRAIDRALALASKCFVALLPLSILSTAVISGREFGDELVRRFGLTGSGARAARQLFATPAEVEAGIGLLGLVILISSSLSLARALERVYLDAWELPPPAGRATLNRLGWLLGMLVIWAVLVELHTLAPHWRSLISTTIAGAVFFLWTPNVLLGRQIPWRRLLPTALITGGSVLALGLGSAVVMPRLVSRNTDRYGLIGLTFSLVSWLFVAALVIVSAAILGAELDRRLRPNGVMRRAPARTSMRP